MELGFVTQEANPRDVVAVKFQERNKEMAWKIRKYKEDFD
jgi:hypothetical protein